MKYFLFIYYVRIRKPPYNLYLGIKRRLMLFFFMICPLSQKGMEALEIARVFLLDKSV